MTRDFFESHFGYDFQHIRIHTDAAAAESSRAVGALAFSLGSHIVFAGGRYAPGTFDGRKLLAHELTHTLQPHDGMIRCCPDPASNTKYDQIATEIRGTKAYHDLSPDDKVLAEDIVTTGKGTKQCLYYASNLHDLFAVVENPPVDLAAQSRATAVVTVQKEEKRLETKEGKSQVGVEESQTTLHEARLTKREGYKHKFYFVDNSNPNDIVVRIKIHPVAKGKGTDADVKQVISLEDATEKAASTAGYSVDIVYVDSSGPDDVFEVGVDPGGWETAGNFKATDANALAHEVHHLFGLDDRYNYIESHARNKDLPIHSRLHWFREQIKRDQSGLEDPNASKSIMQNHYNKPYDDDICKVAGLDVATCMAARQAAGGVHPPATQVQSSILLAAGGGLARSGGRNTWYAHAYIGAELNAPILKLFNPTIGVAFTLVGDPLASGAKPGVYQPDSTLLTSVLLGLREGGPTGGYLSMEAGPSLAVGGSVKLGAEAAVSAGYRWRWFDISVRGAYDYDPTRAGNDQNIVSATANLGVALPF